jgi:hypothetical protein
VDIIRPLASCHHLLSLLQLKGHHNKLLKAHLNLHQLIRVHKLLIVQELHQELLEELHQELHQQLRGMLTLLKDLQLLKAMLFLKGMLILKVNQL